MKAIRICLHTLFSFGVLHPVEFLLILLVIWSFVNAFIKCPSFWNPPTFLLEEDIPRDIDLCSSTGYSGDLDHLPKCPMVVRDPDPNVILNLGILSNPKQSISNPIESISNPKQSISNLNESMSKLGVKRGGSFNPSTCQAVHRAVILVPYRKREEQLRVFLQNMHPFLVHQMINYTIVVVEQVDEMPFNRGKLFNVGFVEMMKINSHCCCFIFHDVDLLPEVSHNMYTCSKNPRHMSPFVNTLRYNLIYSQLCGGVVAMKRSQFKSINGFSNSFFGWGGEDDDLSARIASSGLTITRWPDSVSRYFMLHHRKETPGDDKDLLLDTSDVRSQGDGLSSLEYKVVSITEEPLFTRIQVALA